MATSSLASVKGLFLQKAVERHCFFGHDLKEIARVNRVKDLTPVAERLIGRLGPNFAIGIGPITSGTERTPEENLMLFDQTYDWFGETYGMPVFYQLAFEMDIARLRAKFYRNNEPEFIKALFNEFYKFIFLHDKLHTVLLMPQWDRSTGATIERRMIAARKQKVRFIDVSRRLPNLVKE
jgi:hypothetical protein